MRKLKEGQIRDIKAIAAKRDEDIDFSDAPAVPDWKGAEIGKFYRPKKQPVTMRLDSDVIAWLKADGRGYQTKANWLLRSAMEHQKEASRGRRKAVAKRHNVRGGAEGRSRSGVFGHDWDWNLQRILQRRLRLIFSWRWRKSSSLLSPSAQKWNRATCVSVVWGYERSSA